MPANPFELPNLPTAPNFENIMATIRSISGLPTLSGSVLPEIRGLYGEGGPILQPQVQALRELTGQNVSAAQSDAMRRGITGSSIETANIGQARLGGMQAEGQLRAQVGQSLADLLFRATSGDIQAATQLRQMLAQAMGEELGATRDMSMFNRQLEFAGDQAARNRKNQLISAGIGAAGQLGGAGILLASDRRLKSKIKKIANVLGVDIVRFVWGKNAVIAGLKAGRKGVGVIAQQVRSVFPEAVNSDEGYLRVDYSALPDEVVNAVLVEARG